MTSHSCILLVKSPKEKAYFVTVAEKGKETIDKIGSNFYDIALRQNSDKKVLKMQNTLLGITIIP
jgi:hypothetical protein